MRAGPQSPVSCAAPNRLQCGDIVSAVGPHLLALPPREESVASGSAPGLVGDAVLLRSFAPSDCVSSDGACAFWVETAQVRVPALRFTFWEGATAA